MQHSAALLSAYNSCFSCTVARGRALGTLGDELPGLGRLLAELRSWVVPVPWVSEEEHGLARPDELAEDEALLELGLRSPTLFGGGRPTCERVRPAHA